MMESIESQINDLKQFIQDANRTLEYLQQAEQKAKDDQALVQAQIDKVLVKLKELEESANAS